MIPCKYSGHNFLTLIEEHAMQNIDQIVTAAMVSIIRSVPWGPTRDALEAKADAFASEAAYESGWDNYSTAQHLRWDAFKYRLAAEARFPRDNDTKVEGAKNAITNRLYDIALLKEDRYEEGELIEVNRDNFWSAAMRAIKTEDERDFSIIDMMIEEFAARGKIVGAYVGEIKQRHRDDVEASLLEMSGP